MSLRAIIQADVLFEPSDGLSRKFSRSPTWTTPVLASEGSHGPSSFLQLWCRVSRHHHGRVISTSLSLPTTVLFSTEYTFKSQSHEHEVCTVGSSDCELLVRVLLSPLHVESCLSGQTAIVLLHLVGIGCHVHEHMSREIRCQNDSNSRCVPQ